MKVEIARYCFHHPKLLTREQYLAIKYRASQDPNFSLFDKKEETFNYFKWQILILIITIPLVIGVIYAFVWIPEIYSYHFDYIKPKKEYLSNLLHNVIWSKDFESFHLSFYGIAFDDSKAIYFRNL